MDHPVRFDAAIADPTSVKPYLARLANSEMKKLKESSIYYDRIYIGNHTLGRPEKGAFDLRFVYHNKNQFDGIHFLGPNGKRDFTRSVSNIFKQAGLQYSNEMIQSRFRSFNQEN